MKVGDIARINATIPQGPITDMRQDEGGGVAFELTWTDENGHIARRWFDERELVLVSSEPPQR